MERVTQGFLRLLERSLPDLLAGTAPRTPQDESRASCCRRRVPEDDRIDWSRPARDVHNLVRAVTRPYPGAFCAWNGRVLRVWTAALPAEARRYAGGAPGRVVQVLPGVGSVVSAGDSAILLSEVQVEGGEAVCAADVLTHPGQILE